MGKRVVVTGGAGFIGSHTVDALLARGDEVIVIDNFITGRPENLEHVRSHPGLRVIVADINDVGSTEIAYRNAEWVIHLAARAETIPSIENPLVYHQANVSGTATVLEQARHAKVERFIYAASSSCYGFPREFPTPETAPTNPLYPYALTKYVGEQYVLHWANIYSLPAISLRFFNVYGPRSSSHGTYGAVFGVFLAQKLKGHPFTIVGDGEQSRDFVHVTDVARALIAAADSKVCGEVFNVGSGMSYSVNKLAHLLGGEKVNIPKRPGEPDLSLADISKIQKLLSWTPRVSFEDGVENLLRHIDGWKDAPLWTPKSIKAATKIWFEYLS